MKGQVVFEIKLPFKLIKRKKWFLASCPDLDVHSQGETPKEAENNLVEALSMFLLSCFERGTLDAVLKECGFEAAEPREASSMEEATVSPENYLSVPLPFWVGKPRRAEGRA